jgi:hypothetical protein
VGGRIMIAWAVVLGLAVSVQAAQKEESLADKAARTRKPAPSASPSAPAKVFTNDDLINARGTVIVLPAPEGEEAPPDAGTATTATKPEPTEEEKRAQAGAALQKQIDEQAETIKVAQAAIVDWERELNDLTNYTFGTKRAAVMQSIDEARKVVADAQKSIVDLEEQARRQGVRVTLP